MTLILTRGRCLPALLLILAVLVAACGPSTPAISSLPTPIGGASNPNVSPLSTPAGDRAQLLHEITTSPERYAGRQETVEGVLESRGQMPNPRYYLRGAAGDLLEVTAWAPIDVIQPQQGGAEPKSMAYYAGKELRLTGIVRIGSDGAILEVSAAEER